MRKHRALPAETPRAAAAQVISLNAATYAGGLYLTTASSALLQNVSATNNTATASAGGFIGADGSCSVTITSGSWIAFNSAAAEGGALALGAGGRLLVMSSTLQGNAAGTSGGSCWASTGASLRLQGTRLQENAATLNGGALYAGAGSSVDVSAGAVVSGNAAGEYGGAVWLGTQATFSARDAAFAANVAKASALPHCGGLSASTCVLGAVAQ